MSARWFVWLALLAAPACSIVPRSLAKEPPPLFDLEEPLELRVEPRDEAARQALSPGVFTGIRTTDARQSLDALLDESAGLLVASIVENSPADQAGLEAGDLLLEARVAGRAIPLHWPSEWRAIELELEPGAEIHLTYDRAAVERAAVVVAVPRVRAAAREEGARFREEERVGVVLRTATEVEARASGLGPGGGAVVVGLARASPWRHAGIEYGDLVTAVRGEGCAHPEVLLQAIRAADPGSVLPLEIRRAGQSIHVDARVSRRSAELHEFTIPLLYSYSNDRGHRETSILFGLYAHESTPAAWKTRILWIVTFSGGDSDRLEEERS